MFNDDPLDVLFSYITLFVVNFVIIHLFCSFDIKFSNVCLLGRILY